MCDNNSSDGENELPRYEFGTSLTAMYVDETVNSYSFHHFQNICRACIPDAMAQLSTSTFERTHSELVKSNDHQRVPNESKRTD